MRALSPGDGGILQRRGQVEIAAGDLAAARQVLRRAIGPQLTAIGTFNGRTVYRGTPDGTIWIETAQGLATPWRR